MDLISVLREVDAWPIEDRVLLVQELLDRLVDQGYESELSEDQRDELDRRLAADEEAPEDVVSWEEVKAEDLKRAGPCVSRAFCGEWLSPSSTRRSAGMLPFQIITGLRERGPCRLLSSAVKP